MLVLIYGFGMLTAAWGLLINYFSQSIRVIATNMNGHGDLSSTFEMSYAMRTAAIQ